MAIFSPFLARKLYALSMSITFGIGAFLLTTTASEARRHHSGGSGHTSHGASHTSRSSAHSSGGRHAAGAGGQGRTHAHHHPVATKTRYAYPIDFFMMQAPDFDRSALPPELAQRARSAFESGVAERYTPAYLVRAGAFRYHPLHGGIFKRREEVKYIIIHSVESGVPQDADHCIEGWGSMGRRHPGAQFVVNRDGSIVQAVDPDLGTVHVNIFKTLPGINNDNTIGIEMCHAGSQLYPPEQRISVTRLVSYLQDRYHVLNENIITHKYAQQGDHTDPVNFDFDAFLAVESNFHNKALAMKHNFGPVTPDELAEGAELPTASVYLEIHRFLDPREVLRRRTPSAAAMLKAEREFILSTKDKEDQANGTLGRPSLGAGGNYPDIEPAASQSTNADGPSKGRPDIRGEIELPPGSVWEESKPAE